MRVRLDRLVPVICCLLSMTIPMAAPTAPAAPASVDPGAVTVGDFVVQLADLLNPAPGDIVSLDQAKQVFAAQGVVLPKSLDLGAPLTQADVATVTSLLGVTIQAPQPAERLQGTAVDNFVSALRTGIASGEIPVNATNGTTTPTLAILSTGACCVDGVCTQTNPSCTGGVFRGVGVPCDPNPCGSDYGQCCISRHNCQITTFMDCNSQGGIFTGRDSCHPSGSACRNPQPVTPSEP